jgi:hypothetical protein
MKIMKPQFKIRAHIFGPTFFIAFAMLALAVTASAREPVPAAVLNKLDHQLVLVVKKSRAEAPFDTASAADPDVYKFRGRVLVEIAGVFSRELSDYIASLGGNAVNGWGTTTQFRAWVPFGQLEVLAARSDIKSIAAARPTITHRSKH